MALNLLLFFLSTSLSLSLSLNPLPLDNYLYICMYTSSIFDLLRTNGLDKSTMCLINSNWDGKEESPQNDICIYVCTLTNNRKKNNLIQIYVSPGPRCCGKLRLWGWGRFSRILRASHVYVHMLRFCVLAMGVGDETKAVFTERRRPGADPGRGGRQLAVPMQSKGGRIK